MCKLPDSAERFLNYLAGYKNASNNTIESYRFDLNTFFSWLKNYKNIQCEICDIDKNVIQEITLDDLEQFICSLKNKHTGNSVSARTKARYISMLKSYYKHMVKNQKIISYNVAIEMEYPEIPKVQPKVPKTKEVAKGLNKIDVVCRHELRDKAICVMLIEHGLRVSELCTLDLWQVNNDRIIFNGKGNKERYMYLTETSKKCLDDYLTVRKESSEAALFLNERGNRISRHAVALITKKIFKCSPHKIRHLFTTLQIESGTDIQTLMELLGHSNITTTKKYMHINDKRVQEASRRGVLGKIVSQ